MHLPEGYNSTLWPEDSRVPSFRYCMPWTMDGATPAGAASPSACQEQCSAVPSCVAITYYPDHSIYSDQCYLFRACGTTGLSSDHGGRVWRRPFTNPNTPPPPSPSPPPLPPSPDRLVPDRAGEYTVLVVYASLLPGILLLMNLPWILHMRRLRRNGQTTTCWGFIRLVPAPPPPRLSAESVDEQSAQSAIELLPCEVWDADVTELEDDDDAAMCSLCLQNYERGDEVTKLACEHTFHKACVTRWLSDAQRGKKRRCPLCNLDPLALETPPATSSRTSTPASTPSPPARRGAPSDVPPIELIASSLVPPVEV